MKYLLFFCIAGLLSCNAFSQADANWVFGNKAGLKFLDGETIPFKSSIYSVESCASMSDKNGNLLFYTDGVTIWDSTHEVMDNGNEIYTNYLDSFSITSCTQGSLIIPVPDTDSLFYIFSLSPFVSDPGLVYSIVDMSMNDGRGKVILKANLLLAPDLSERLEAVKHANGRDWWLIGHQLNTNSFYEFLITDKNIIGPIFQEAGNTTLTSIDQFGQISASLNGELLSLGTYDTIEIFSFDRCSGMIILLNSFPAEFGRAYSLEFSKSKEYIYISNWSKKLYQLKINPDDGNIIESNLLYEITTSNHDIGQLKMGTDEKIYIAIYYDGATDTSTSLLNKNLSVINFPDNYYLDSDFDTATISLGGESSFSGLPNMPNYNLGALEGSPCDTLSVGINNATAMEAEIKIYPNPVTDFIYIKSEIEQKYYYTIKNIFSEKLLSGVLYAEEKIHIKQLASGVYFLELSDVNNHVIQTEKIVKQ